MIKMSINCEINNGLEMKNFQGKQHIDSNVNYKYFVNHLINTKVNKLDHKKIALEFTE